MATDLYNCWSSVLGGSVTLRKSFSLAQKNINYFKPWKHNKFDVLIIILL